MDGLLEFAKQIVAAALGSGVVFGLFKMFWEQRRESKHRSEREKHLAIHVAQHLESFAITSADRLNDDMQWWNGDGRNGGTPMAEYPRISAPPASTDYVLLDNKLVDRLLALPLECETSIATITAAFDALDGDEAYEIKREELLTLLKGVFTLSADFRARYGLGERPGKTNGVFDREEWVDDELAEIAERREKVRQEHARLWANVPTPTTPSER